MFFSLFIIYTWLGYRIEIVYSNKYWYNKSSKHCKWVRYVSGASIRSVENCSSLEIFNASMTDVQAITRICHAQYCFKGTLMQIRKSP